MLKNLKNNKGFASFVEVVVTAIIFILAAFGIFTTISMLRPQGDDSAKRLEAAYVGKAAFDQLRSYVHAGIWDNALGPMWPGIVHNLAIGDYNVTYYLTDMPDGTRSIDLNVYSPYD